MWVGRRTIKLAGVAIVVGLVATSCTSDDGTASPSPTSEADSSTTVGSGNDDDNDETIGDDVADVSTAEDGFLEMVEVRSDIDLPSSVEVLEVTEGDAELIVTFEMGSQQCHGVDASVEEVGGEVVLNVQTGALPDVSEPCVEGVYPYQVAVPLEEPLEDRAVRQAEPEEPVEEPPAEPLDEALANGRPNVDHLIGLPVEDAVLWAIDNDLEWQLTSYEGVPREVDGVDDNRLSFEVESDKIVRIEWA